VDTPEQMFTVKRSPVDVVLKTGTAVLKADDPLVADMAPLSAGGGIFFSRHGAHPRMAAHRAGGKRAGVVREGAGVRAGGMRETPLAALADIPLTHGGRVGFHVENVLAAAGAAWALQIDPAAIRGTLSKFQSDMQDCPGRFNLLDIRGTGVVIDDSHNTSALAALIDALDQFPY